MKLKKMTSNQSLTWTCTNQTTSWLMQSLNIFNAKIHHKQIRIHKTHHGPDLREATTFPVIVDSVLGHRTSTQMAFCPRTPKWESRNSQSWNIRNFGGVYFVCRPQIEMNFEAKFQPFWRAFRRYVACHLCTKKSGRFLTFSGRE